MYTVLHIITIIILTEHTTRIRIIIICRARAWHRCVITFINVLFSLSCDSRQLF